MPQPIGRWNPTRSLWETDRFDLLSEHSEPFSETWPTSGSMRSGSAFGLPTSAPRIAGSGSSSSRRLPTPEAKLAVSGRDYARSSRPGSGGDDLTTAIDRPLPTPVTTDAEAARRHTTTTGNSHTGTTLSDAMLPTPTTANAHGNDENSRGESLLPGIVKALPPLFPTPSAAVRNDSETAEAWEERYVHHASKEDGATRAGYPLEIFVKVLDRTGAHTPASSTDGSDASAG